MCHNRACPGHLASVGTVPSLSRSRGPGAPRRPGDDNEMARSAMLHRRSVLAGLSAAVVVPRVRAQVDYPTHAITLIVPFPAGGSTDVIARVVADAMHGVLDVPVIVE